MRLYFPLSGSVSLSRVWTARVSPVPLMHNRSFSLARVDGSPKENRDGFWDTYTPAWEAARENYRGHA